MKIIYRLFLLIAATMLFLAGGMAWDIHKGLRENPHSPAEIKNDVFIDRNTIIRREIFYTLSQRTVSSVKAADEELYGKNAADLKALGWNSFRSGAGQVVLYKEENALSPQDEIKRHIKLYPDKVVVYAGPSSADGAMLYQLNIKIADLPANMLERLTKGIDFADENELHIFLENLDEY
jgi:hypothetical protein